MFCVRREEKGDGWAGSWGDSQKKHHEEELTWTRRLARIIFLFLSRKILISRYFASSSHPSIWPFFFPLSGLRSVAKAGLSLGLGGSLIFSLLPLYLPSFLLKFVGRLFFTIQKCLAELHQESELEPLPNPC